MNTCSNYADGLPPRDASSSNLTVSGVSKSCSVTANEVNAGIVRSAGVVTSVIQIGDQLITPEVVSGQSYWSAAVSGLTNEAPNSAVVLSAPTQVNEGPLPFVLTVTADTGAWSVDKTGTYNVSINVNAQSLAGNGDVLTVFGLSLVSDDTSRLLVFNSIPVNTDEGFYASVSGLVSLVADTEYQFFQQFDTTGPTSATIEPNSAFHITRIH